MRKDVDGNGLSTIWHMTKKWAAKICR